jgi:hypothetical protein
MATFNNIDSTSELQNAIATAKNNGQADTINITGNISAHDLLIQEDVSRWS